MLLLKFKVPTWYLLYNAKSIDVVAQVSAWCFLYNTKSSTNYVVYTFMTGDARLTHKNNSEKIK